MQNNFEVFSLSQSKGMTRTFIGSRGKSSRDSILIDRMFLTTFALCTTSRMSSQGDDVLTFIAPTRMRGRVNMLIAMVQFWKC